MLVKVRVESSAISIREFNEKPVLLGSREVLCELRNFLIDVKC
jgi:hypothetical protein